MGGGWLRGQRREESRERRDKRRDNEGILTRQDIFDEQRRVRSGTKVDTDER